MGSDSEIGARFVNSLKSYLSRWGVGDFWVQRLVWNARTGKHFKVAYHINGVTDATGTCRITVADDHEELCESVLISSPQTNCTAKTLGRDRSRVILTNNNGIISNIRHDNAMGFTKDSALWLDPTPQAILGT
ncbi:pollen-specific protein C13-like [Macadamia integrifolia]|uniref:pollen-specific protein C13-like n=1 Tax=Macadamia integrifolia TaxID=60698 RepID=UPI001C4F5682|nr:pollen-specific protein C13-like [Macadamia integrifolia]